MLAGVQLFSLRKYLKGEAGYERVFSRVHEMGAEVVQLSGGKPVPAEFIRGLTEKYSLPVCVTHDNFDRLQNDLAGLVKEHRTYGCDALGIGMMPGKFRTGKLADIAAFAGVLNSLAESLAGEGMTIAYHNHWFEFDEVEGHVIYDYLIENSTSRTTNASSSAPSARGTSISSPSSPQQRSAACAAPSPSSTCLRVPSRARNIRFRR